MISSNYNHTRFQHVSWGREPLDSISTYSCPMPHFVLLPALSSTPPGQSTVSQAALVTIL